MAISRGPLIDGPLANISAPIRTVEKTNTFVIDHHNYDIWEGKDGRWKTYISDEDKPKGRRQISRATKNDLVEYLYKMYIEEDVDFLRKQASMESLYDEWAEYKSIFVTESTIKRSANSWRSYKSYCYDTTTDIERHAAISRAMAEIKPQEKA